MDFGSGTDWDCVSIVRITYLPPERVSEENHELGLKDDVMMGIVCDV